MTVSEGDLKRADQQVKVLSYTVDTLRAQLAYYAQSENKTGREQATIRLKAAVSELDAAKREQARLGKLYFTQRWRTG